MARLRLALRVKFGVLPKSIRILASDTTDPLWVLKGIPDVRNAFETIDQARRAERRRRALRIGAV